MTSITDSNSSGNQVNLPISGASVPSSLSGIVVQVSVAGQQVTQNFSPSPNQNFSYTWNGQNGYGQQVQGKQPITVTVTYQYPPAEENESPTS